MRKIKIILVDKTRGKYFQLAEQDFQKRLRHYTKLEVVIVRGEKIRSGFPEVKIKKTEARRISDKFQPGEYRVVLAKAGQQLSSEELAQFLDKLAQSGNSRLCFIIGGPLGLPADFEKSCNFRLSLSKMTFTHEMARTILLEQLYRAFTILNNEKYHK